MLMSRKLHLRSSFGDSEGLMKYYVMGLACLAIGACVSKPSISASSFGNGLSLTSATAQAGQMDPMLSWIGGLSTVAGILALVLTRGSVGTRAIVIGIGLVLLNQAIARYGDWLFLPTLIATGAVSVTYGYITIRRMMRLRQEN